MLTKEQKTYRKKLDETLDRYLIYAERDPCRYDEIVRGTGTPGETFFFAAVKPALRGALLGLIEDEQENE